MLTTETIRKTLAQVMDPELNRNIVELGMVHDIEVHDGIITFTLALTTMACPLRAHMQQDARERLMALPGVRDVIINLREMTAEEKQALMGPSRQGMASGFNRIKRVIAVVSGKGGVGKSSVSALLAIGLSRRGYQVGLLDADITGPSIPKMLLTNPQRPLGSPNGILPVLSQGGIKVMSINLLLENPNQAVIWRGPLISGAITQFYHDVAWGALDYLIVDLPPGTSDASLTVMQSLPLSGILLVTTPQSLAGMVVRKASSMAEQLGIPILGVIENMSYAVCPNCGHAFDIFGPSRAQELADELNVPLLARLPIEPALTELADTGRLETYQGETVERITQAIVNCLPPA